MEILDRQRKPSVLEIWGKWDYVLNCSSFFMWDKREFIQNFQSFLISSPFLLFTQRNMPGDLRFLQIQGGAFTCRFQIWVCLLFCHCRLHLWAQVDKPRKDPSTTLLQPRRNSWRSGWFNRDYGSAVIWARNLWSRVKGSVAAATH